MEKKFKIISYKLFLAIAVMFVSSFLASKVALAGDCNEAVTLVDPEVNVLTGIVTLKWEPMNGARNYNIAVSCVGQSFKYDNISGGETSLEINDDAFLRLAAFTKCTYTVQAVCCIGDCSNCSIGDHVVKNDLSTPIVRDYRPDSGESFCTALNEVFPSNKGNSCFCQDPNFPWCNPGSFVFKDVKLPGGHIVTTGCEWSCNLGAAGNNVKKCGIDYSLVCGYTNGKKIASSVLSDAFDSFGGLCKIFDGQKYFADRNGLAWKGLTGVSPMISSEPLKQPALKWDWRCAFDPVTNKDATSCQACRLAECGSAYGKFYNSEDEFKKAFLADKAKPNSELFCDGFADSNKDAVSDHQPTTKDGAKFISKMVSGVPQADSNGNITWDCLGETACDRNGDVNKNNIPMNEKGDMVQKVSECKATILKCGSIDGGTITQAQMDGVPGNNRSIVPFKDNTNGELCPKGSVVEAGSLRLTKKTLADPTPSAKDPNYLYYNEAWYWRCEFVNLGGSGGINRQVVYKTCGANKADCQLSSELSSYSKKKADITRTTPYNLTENSLNDFLNNKIKIDQEKYEKVYKVKPSDVDYFCRNGKTALIEATNVKRSQDGSILDKNYIGKKQIGWYYVCYANANYISYENKCLINKTACGVLDGSYAQKKPIEFIDKFCENAGNLATSGKVVYDALNNKIVGYGWFCEDDMGEKIVCSSKKLDCSPKAINIMADGDAYSTWASFEKAMGIKACIAIPGNTDRKRCDGVCNDPSFNQVTVELGIDPDSGKKVWNWVCGQDDDGADVLPLDGKAQKCQVLYAGCSSDVCGAYDHVNLAPSQLAIPLTMEGGLGFDCTENGVNKWKCKGLCSDNQTIVDVEKVTFPNVNLGDKEIRTGWVWSCGNERCTAKEGGCLSSPEAYDNQNIDSHISFDDNADMLKTKFFCKNGGKPVFYKQDIAYQYTYGPNGFIRYGGHEWDVANGKPFDNEALNKEGTWLWRCEYDNSQIEGCMAGNLISPSDPSLGSLRRADYDDVNKVQVGYCHAKEVAKCAVISDEKKTQGFTRDELAGYMFDMDNAGTPTADCNGWPCVRGNGGGNNTEVDNDSKWLSHFSANVPLCSQGVVAKSDQFVFGSNGFNCAKGICSYTCVAPGGNSETCIVKHQGGCIEPNGKNDLLDSEIEAYVNEYNNPGVDSAYKGGTDKTNVLFCDGGSVATMVQRALANRNVLQWTCDGEQCAALKTDCKEPPHATDTTYVKFATDWYDFSLKTWKNNPCDSGPETDPVYSLADKKWKWKCAENDCYANSTCGAILIVRATNQDNQVCEKDDNIGFNLSMQNCAKAVFTATDSADAMLKYEALGLINVKIDTKITGDHNITITGKCLDDGCDGIVRTETAVVSVEKSFVPDLSIKGDTDICEVIKGGTEDGEKNHAVLSATTTNCILNPVSPYIPPFFTWTDISSVASNNGEFNLKAKVDDVTWPKTIDSADKEDVVYRSYTVGAREINVKLTCSDKCARPKEVTGTHNLTIQPEVNPSPVISVLSPNPAPETYCEAKNSRFMAEDKGKAKCANPSYEWYCSIGGAETYLNSSTKDIPFLDMEYADYAKCAVGDANNKLVLKLKCDKSECIAEKNTLKTSQLMEFVIDKKLTPEAKFVVKPSICDFDEVIKVDSNFPAEIIQAGQCKFSWFRVKNNEAPVLLTNTSTDDTSYMLDPKEWSNFGTVADNYKLRFEWDCPESMCMLDSERKGGFTTEESFKIMKEETLAGRKISVTPFKQGNVYCSKDIDIADYDFGFILDPICTNYDLVTTPNGWEVDSKGLCTGSVKKIYYDITSCNLNNAQPTVDLLDVTAKATYTCADENRCIKSGSVFDVAATAKVERAKDINPKFAAITDFCSATAKDITVKPINSDFDLTGRCSKQWFIVALDNLDQQILPDADLPNAPGPSFGIDADSYTLYQTGDSRTNIQPGRYKLRFTWNCEAEKDLCADPLVGYIDTNAFTISPEEKPGSTAKKIQDVKDVCENILTSETITYEAFAEPSCNNPMKDAAGTDKGINWNVAYDKQALSCTKNFVDAANKYNLGECSISGNDNVLVTFNASYYCHDQATKCIDPAKEIKFSQETMVVAKINDPKFTITSDITKVNNSKNKVCSDQRVVFKFDSFNAGSCSNPEYRWVEKKLPNFIEFEPAEISDMYVTYGKTIANKKIDLRIKCNNECTNFPDGVTADKSIEAMVIEEAEEPKVTITGNKNVCANEPTTLEASFPTSSSCTGQWYKNGVIMNGEDQAKLVVTPSAKTTYRFKVTCTSADLDNKYDDGRKVCNDKYSDGITDTITVMPVVCSCGSADGGSYTKEEYFADDMCNGTGKAININEVDGVWNWDCDYDNGLIKKGCSAFKLACGDANGNKMTTDRWNSKYIKDLCKKGDGSVAVAESDGYAHYGIADNEFVTLNSMKINPLDASQNKISVKKVSPGGDYPLTTGTNWLCKGDSANDKDVVSCKTDIVSCGYPSAEQAVANGKQIKPYTNNLFYGSFNDSQFAEVLNLTCINSSGSFPENKGRGLYYWTCAGSDPVDEMVCSARMDCGYMSVKSGDKTIAENYSTIRFRGTNNKGVNYDKCWTAEDVRARSDSGRETADLYFNDVLAVDETLWVNAAAPYEYPKFSHGIADNGFLNYQPDNIAERSFKPKINPIGVCDDVYNPANNFVVPNDDDWNELEAYLAEDVASCDNRRYNESNAKQGFDCNVAGADGSGDANYDNDGLKNPYGFNAVAGVGYWTGSTDYITDQVKQNNPSYASQICTGIVKANERVRCGNTIPLALDTRYCKRSPFYRKFNNSDMISRYSDYNEMVSGYCDPRPIPLYPNKADRGGAGVETVHKLRCIYNPTATPPTPKVIGVKITNKPLKAIKAKKK